LKKNVIPRFLNAPVGTTGAVMDGGITDGHAAFPAWGWACGMCLPAVG